MKKILSIFLLGFYIVIILYLLLAILNINTLKNFSSALLFEIIGFFILAYFIFCNVFSTTVKIGYFIPLLLSTLIYTIVLNIVNIVFITSVSSVFFTLIHLLILFVYCLISIPIYLMGRR